MSELIETQNDVTDFLEKDKSPEELVKNDDSCSKESDSSERENPIETEEDGPTLSVIDSIASEEEEDKDELLEIDKCMKEYEELEIKSENENCDEETHEKSTIVKKKNVLKIMITDETEKPENELDLTPKEREYLENLIFLDESDGDNGILVETKNEIITDKNFSSPPIKDKTSPFFIDQSQYHHMHHIPVKLFQEYLLEGWSPAEVLYKLCGQCVWTGPEYRFIGLPEKAGLWCSVTVNNHEFMSFTKAKRKTDARNLASSKVLKFLGFNFSYQQWKKRNESVIPWGEKYGECNSEAITKEDMERDDYKPFEWKPEDSLSYEHRRSSHRESRKSPDHRSSGYRSWDHRLSDRRSSDRRSSDRRSSDHRSSDHRLSDHRSSDHRSSDHRSSDRRSSDHRSSDHRSSDYRSTDHRSSDHRADSPERRRVTPKRKRSFDEESIRRECRRRTSPESYAHRKSFSSPIKRRD